MEIALYRIVAEGTDGAYFCQGKKGKVSENLLVGAVVCGIFRQLFPYSVAHFLGGGIGEGYYEKIGNIAVVVLVDDSGYDSLGKYGGFTASCACRDY